MANIIIVIELYIENKRNPEDMNRIPTKLNKEMNEDPCYRTCMRYGYFGHECHGRLNTREHALIYAGKQVQEKWAILSICAYGHGVDNYQDRGDMVKEIHEWIALSRATDEDLAKYQKSDWIQMKKYLIKKYGTWVQKFPASNPSGINY